MMFIDRVVVILCGSHLLFLIVVFTLSFGMNSLALSQLNMRLMKKYQPYLSVVIERELTSNASILIWTVAVTFRSLNIHKITIITAIRWNKQTRQDKSWNQIQYIHSVAFVAFVYDYYKFVWATKCVVCLKWCVLFSSDYVQFLRRSSLHISFLKWTWILGKKKKQNKTHSTSLDGNEYYSVT